MKKHIDWCTIDGQNGHNYKYFLLFLLFFGGSFIIIIINTETEIAAVTLSVTTWDVAKFPFENDDKLYAIRTMGCTISGFEPLDTAIKDFVKQPKEKSCMQSYKGPLTKSDEGTIWIAEEHFMDYGITNKYNLSCCYMPFYRPKFIDDIDSNNLDDRVKYGDCVEFDTLVPIKDEFIRVLCYYKNEQIYEDFHAFVPIKDSVKRSFNQNISNTTFNVLIMGLDAISRMNFHRTMPKTSAFLRSLDSVEFMGYNKVGDNTFPNLIPLLMGLRDDDLKHICLPRAHSTFDNCPFIWNWFKEIGFATAFGEDSSILGTFNYLQNGFISNPTDYYLHTFIHESEKFIGRDKDFNDYVCMGTRFYYEVLLDYILKLSYAMSDMRYFGFFWEISMSHDYLNYPMLMDKSYELFFKNMNDSGFLDDTIVILMSDHGMRWGNIRQTKQGRMEERLPLVNMVFPQRFIEKYPVAFASVQQNARRLTTPFDLHETLMDLRNLSEIEGKALRKRLELPYGDERGISLFLPVLTNRTCESAAIDDHWCTCHQTKKANTNSSAVRDAAKYVIEHLNGLLSEYRQCSDLELSEILDATEYDLSQSALDSVVHMWRDFTLVVRVKPSDAVLEATLRGAPGEWKLAGTVSRLNLYGEQSRCVDNYHMKLYCYCR